MWQTCICIIKTSFVLVICQWWNCYTFLLIEKQPVLFTWLFISVDIKKNEIDKRFFLKLSFANKGLDAINVDNIRHHKSNKSKIPPYFKDQSVPIASYTDTVRTYSVVYLYSLYI